MQRGTPARFLQPLFMELGVRLVIYNGSECRYVHVPSDWESLPERRRKTIVLNVWGDHVFTYDNPQARNPKVKPAHYVKARVQTLMEVEDRTLFIDTQEVDWGALQQVVVVCFLVFLARLLNVVVVPLVPTNEHLGFQTNHVANFYCM